MSLGRSSRSHLTAIIALVAGLTGTHAAEAAELGPLAGLPLGDTDQNGVVDITDALRIAQYDSGTDIGRDLYDATADLNGDLKVDIVDALLVAQQTSGLITSFPVANTSHVFQDPIVALAARRALGKADNAPVSLLELRLLRTLKVQCSLTARETVNLGDLPYMTNLNNLRINACTVADPTPLASLALVQTPKRVGTTATDSTRPTWYTRLTSLDLHYTATRDLSALSGLRALTSLDLGWNSLSDLSPLQGLTSLTVLNLTMSEVTDISPLAKLGALQRVDLGWTGVTDLSPLGSLANLRQLDIRVTLADPGPLAGRPSLQLKSQGRELITCRPGALIGDYDGDNAVTTEDVQMLRSLFVPKGFFASGVVPSDDIRCLDLNGSGLIDEGDVTVLEQLAAGTTPSRGTLKLKCPTYAIKGDADGDGRVTQTDVDLVGRVALGTLATTGSDLCCIDLDRSGRVTTRDRDLVAQLVQGTLPTQGVCGDDAQGIGLATYDLEWTAQNGGVQSDVPLELISDLHQRIVNNPMLGRTDVVVLPEYAYSSWGNPVELDPPAEGSTTYTIGNQNPVSAMVEELVDLSRQYQLSLVVPLAELAVPNAENQLPCQAIIDSAILVDKGAIRHVRRSIALHAECEVTALVAELQRKSYRVHDLQARNGRHFTGTIAICAEHNGEDFQNLVKASHPNLILFPEGIVNPTGRDMMAHIQLFQDGASLMNASYMVTKSFAALAPYSDYLVHAALAIGPLKSQGVFSMAVEPLPYMFTRQFDDGGYLYARVNIP